MTTPVTIGTALPPRIVEAISAGRIAPVSAELRETSAERAARERRALEYRRSRWEANLPSMFAAASLRDLASDQHPRPVSAWWGAGHQTLVLFSPRPGNGKSHAAYAVGRHAVEHGAVTEGWSVPDMLAALRPASREVDHDVDLMERLMEADLLLLDDLGKEKDTDWTREQMHRLIDGRLREGRRQIVTTNLADEALTARYSESLVDRLVADAVILEFTGPSRRKPARWGA